MSDTATKTYRICDAPSDFLREQLALNKDIAKLHPNQTGIRLKVRAIEMTLAERAEKEQA